MSPSSRPARWSSRRSTFRCRQWSRTWSSCYRPRPPKKGWRSPPSSTRARAKPNRSLAGARILVVDDMEINRSIFCRQLESEGAVLVEAEDGPAALGALIMADARGEPFDVVILDHMMPGLSGEQVAVKI